MTINDSVSWYQSHFPEDLFPPKRERAGEFKNLIIQGAEIASRSKILVCGLVRDAEQVLPLTIARLRRLVSFFKDYRIYVVENDSQDNTKKILKNWCFTDGRVIIKIGDRGLPRILDKSEERRKNMALLRNVYLEFAQTVNFDYDYLLVYDYDILGGFSYFGIFNSLAQADWEVMTSNGLCYRINKEEKSGDRVYYDSWAFRPKNTWEDQKDKPNLLTLNRGDDLLEVNSAFGGIALYRKDIIRNKILSYDSTECDHVTLHKQIKSANGRIFVNPNQIVLYSTHLYCM